jgi:hypothetical protein
MSSFVRCRPASILLAVISSCVLAGCGKSTPLHGTVIYDGQPVEHGLIVFIPAEDSDSPGAQLAKVAVQVNDGKYSLSPERPLASGKYRVEITWEKVISVTGKNKNNLKIEKEQLLPEKYNTESTLIRDVQSSDSTLDFNLEK